MEKDINRLKVVRCLHVISYTKQKDEKLIWVKQLA